MDIKEAMEKRKEFEVNLITKALEDDNFRKELLENPKAALSKETGQEIPEELKVNIIEEESGTLTIVLPKKPATVKESGELTEEALEQVAGGGNVGTAVAFITSISVACTAVA